MAMGLEGISWACSPISRDHLIVLVASLQDGDNLTAKPGVLSPGRGNRSRNTSMCRLCFVHQPNSSSGLSCTPWALCNYLVTGDLLCLYLQLICRALNLSQYSRDLCCHFLVEWDVQHWTIPQWLNKQSHCCCLPPLNTSDRRPKTSAAPSEWSTGCFGIQQEIFHWTDFCSNMETTVIKPLENYLLLLGTVLSAVLNYLYALKNILACWSVA